MLSFDLSLTSTFQQYSHIQSIIPFTSYVGNGFFLMGPTKCVTKSLEQVITLYENYVADMSM